MTNRHKNPFFKLTDSELAIINDEELDDTELDNLIDLMTDKIRRYYKLRYYQKLYYYNTHLKNTQIPYTVNGKMSKSNMEKIYIFFD